VRLTFCLSSPGKLVINQLVLARQKHSEDSAVGINEDVRDKRSQTANSTVLEEAAGVTGT
jgi:hypothetical protein